MRCYVKSYRISSASGPSKALLTEGRIDCMTLYHLLQLFYIARHVHLGELESLPPVTAALLQFLHSEPFCRLLSHLTGLDLAENVMRPVELGGKPCSSTGIECGVNGAVDCSESSGVTEHDRVSQEKVCHKFSFVYVCTGIPKQN